MTTSSTAVNLGALTDDQLQAAFERATAAFDSALTALCFEEMRNRYNTAANYASNIQATLFSSAN